MINAYAVNHVILIEWVIARSSGLEKAWAKITENTWPRLQKMRGQDYRKYYLPKIKIQVLTFQICTDDVVL